jgi:hypothetical protein
MLRPKLDAKAMILGTPEPSFRLLLSFFCKEMHAKMNKTYIKSQNTAGFLKKIAKNAEK